MLENIIIIAVLSLVVGGAGAYIVREKKRGKKCIGCPYGDSCKGSCGNSKEK